jgi:predicted regulator of Ras-like GTPase activity (Roadblock/LC7/MglB family)
MNDSGDLRSVTAIFDDAAKAERAVDWLINIGVQKSQIRQAAQPGADHRPPATPAPAPAPKKRKGLMGSLVDFVLPEDGKSTNGLPGAGPRTVRVSNISGTLYDTVVTILNDEGQVQAEMPAPEPVRVAVVEPQAPTLAVPNVQAAEVQASPVQVPLVQVPAAQATAVQAPAVEVPAFSPRDSDLSEASNIPGLIGACLVDSDSGRMLASEGNGKIDLGLVAALNTKFMRTWDYTVEQLALEEPLDEILMTLEKQIHLFRPLEKYRSILLYVALDKATCNLGMARIQLKTLEANLAS